MSTSFDQKAIIMNFRIKGGGVDSDQGGGERIKNKDNNGIQTNSI